MKKLYIRIATMLLSLMMVSSLISCNNASNEKTYEEDKGKMGITSATDGTMLLNGTPIYAFGVNVFDVFCNKRLVDPDFDAEAPFKALHEAGIPIARVSIGPYHVAHLSKYMYSRDEYFEALDAVIAAAEKWEIGIFASICWNSWVIPEMVGEHLSAMGNEESKTVELAKQYYCDVVTRYKDSPAIWAWEFGNEYNLNADLGYIAGGLEYLPGQVTFTNEPRTWADYYTSYDIQKYYTVISDEIRKIDPDRLIVGGDSDLSERPASLRENCCWGTDTVEDIMKTTELYAPSTMKAVSSHMYQGAYSESTGYRDFESLINNAVTAAKNVNRGYYIGEYGPGTCWNDKISTEDVYETCVTRIMDAVVSNKVQIALAWLCTTDYDGSEKSLGSDLGTWWFNETIKYNKAYKDSGKQDNIAEYWANAKKTADYDAVKDKCSNYLMGTGTPGCALKITDSSALVYWTTSNYSTDASVTLENDTLDGKEIKVFKLSNNTSSSKTFVKNGEVKGLSTEGSYKLSFYLKCENTEGSGLLVKAGSPNFFTAENVKCDKNGEWQYFEFDMGAPEKEKDAYSVSFTFDSQKGTVYLYGVKISDR